jgi:hypothetical protein
MEYNIIYATQGVPDVFREEVRRLIVENGDAVSDITRLGRVSVEQSLSKYKRGDGVVLILPVYIDEGQTCITMETLNSFRTSVPDVKIIVIFSERHLGSPFIKDMLQEGYTLGLLDKEAIPNKVAQLILHGREYADAKRYYGINDSINLKDSLNNFAMFNIDTGLVYMKKELVGGETYAERLRWVKEHSDKNVYIDVIRALPSAIKDEIRQDETFDFDFAEGYGIAERADAKNNIAIKRIIQEASEETFPNGAEVRIKREISSAVSRAVKRVMIGVASTGEKIGATHQTILIANFLRTHGYHVAVIEDSRVKSPAMEALGAAYSRKIGDSFRLKDIDFYPLFNLENLNFLNPKNYQFFVVDFGTLTDLNVIDYGACVKQVLVCGSQPWNFDKVQGAFSLFPSEAQCEQLNFLFMSTPRQDCSVIRKEMKPLINVFFGKYYPDPMTDVEDDDMCYDVFKDYIDVRADKGKKALSFLKNRFK